MLHEIFKNKGASCLRGGYRDVLLVDDSGKHSGKYVRHKLLPRAKSLVFPTQFRGGFNGGETSFAHMYVRCVFDSCKSVGKSCGVVFRMLSLHSPPCYVELYLRWRRGTKHGKAR